MKRGGRGRRLIRMRGVGMLAVGMLTGALAAGCSSGGSAKAGTSSLAGTSGVSSPTPMVSVGSPSPSDVASRSRVAAVTELARRLLAEVVVPDGAKQLRTPPVGLQTAPQSWEGDDDIIDVADSWTAPETAEVVLAYVEHHLPVGLTWDGSIGAGVVFYQAPAGPTDEGATVYISVASDPAGGTDLRVDVQDTWQPVRPVLEKVPATVTGATLVRRTGVTTSPPPSTTVTIQVGVDIARHIAALLNALPSEAGGLPDAGGGADTTITVTFDRDPSNVQYVVAGSFYDAVTVKAPSQALPTLSGAGDLDTYLEGLF